MADHSQIHKTAQTFVDGYNAWDIDAIMANRAPNCTMRAYPARLNRPALGNEEYRAYFSKIMPHFTNFKIEVIEFIEDAKRQKVAMYARSSAQTAIGPYANEYTLILQLTDDHRQIVEIKEFVDSDNSIAFFKRLNESAQTVLVPQTQEKS